jgi:hypothetical protein
MIISLEENKKRTFVFSEMVFFKKWYEMQKQEIKDKVKTFLTEGRLEFVNGGWVMNDEATPIYQDIINQMRLGMDFLYSEFQIIPKIGWSLDPFGHSATHVKFKINFRLIY